MSYSFSVCVFCGARDGVSDAHKDAAETLGRGIAQAGWRLVYGAGDQGIMGAVSRATIATNGATLGVIPERLVTEERRNRPGSDVVVTQTMHARKALMYDNADAFVVLPGGIGTLDEFFEVLTWKFLRHHNKPIFVVNIDGYWDDLVALLNSVSAGGFADADMMNALSVVESAEAVIAELAGVAT